MSTLFAWGANSYGQLCLGHCTDTLQPSQCPIGDDVNVGRVTAITGGGGHTALITGDGELWTAGWNAQGQLGVGHMRDLPLPTQVPDLPKVTSVSCGWNHTLVTTGSGQMWVWGSNRYGQLGIGPPRDGGADFVATPHPLPVEVFGNERVISCAAGLRHSLAVDVSGCVYAWGSGRKGQLGMGPETIGNVNKPQRVSALDGVHVMEVVAGCYHSVALTARGEVFTWGLNDHGQCGVPAPHRSAPPPGEGVQSRTDGCKGVPSLCGGGGGGEGVAGRVGVKHIWFPQRLDGIEPVAQVHSGWSHVVIVTKSGKVFSWGRNSYGELGVTTQPSANSSWKPKEIVCLNGVRKVVCGSEHNMAITAEGVTVSWGWNEHGMCGDGTEDNVLEPKPIPNLSKQNVILIGTGAGHSFAVCTSNGIQRQTLKLTQ